MDKVTLVVDLEGKTPNLTKINFNEKCIGGKVISICSGTAEEELKRIILKHFERVPNEEDPFSFSDGDCAIECLEEIIRYYDLNEETSNGK